MNVREYKIEEKDGSIVVSATLSPGPIDVQIRMPSIMRSKLLDALDDAEEGAMELAETLRGELS